MLVPAQDGSVIYWGMETTGGHRVCAWRTVLEVRSREHAYEAAYAFGDFQYQLRDLPAIP